MQGEEIELLKELEILRKEHENLDTSLKYAITSDQISLQRLKKRKLWIKDRISVIEGIIYPDIIA